MRVLALIALLVGACSFKAGEVTGDGIQPSNVMVGFASDTTLTDEETGATQVHVVLSEVSTNNVSVAYSFAGNTASKGTDFTATDGTLTFAPGEMDKTIDFTILPDSLDEGAETFDISLSAPVNAKLATAKNTVTIAASPLPRVSFTTTTASGPENTSTVMIDVMLDRSPTAAVTVDLTPSGAATGGGTDYTLSTTTVMFAVGETTKQVTMTVVDDTLDENDEDAILSLTNPTAALLAATNIVDTYTITDNDNPPDVHFAAATSSVAENVAGGTVDITVSLSTASGRDITVAFSDAGTGTATSGAANDYTIATTSPLTIPAGMTSRKITLNIVNDTAVEGSETVVITLGTVTFATPVAPQTHTLTINDDDGDCEGNGNYKACFATGKIVTGGLNLSGALNTGSSGMCKTPDSGGTAAPNTCWIVADSITIDGALTVTGSKNLALIAQNGLTVSFNIEASSKQAGATGPGYNYSGCDAYSNFPNNANGGNGNGAGGGAGGSFRSAGGDGASGGEASPNGGGTAVTTSVATAPTILRGGCPGEAGGNATNGNGAGAAGNGGGAVYLFAGGTLMIGNGISINVSGGGGSGGPGGNNGGNDAGGGGGGGGSGGMIKLVAGLFSVSGAKLVANGGGGAQGGDNNSTGDFGDDPNPANPTTVAAGGNTSNNGGVGGAGFAGSTPAVTPANASSDNAGGGGGGGGGHIESNAALTSATTSAGAVLNNVP